MFTELRIRASLHERQLQVCLQAVTSYDLKWLELIISNEWMKRIGSKRWFLSEKRNISHRRINIEILKATSVVVAQQRGYDERWKCWLNWIGWFRRANTKPSLTGSNVLSTTENFWVIPGQREVYRATWRRDHFSADSGWHQQIIWTSTTTTEAWRIWINDSHHQAYCIC